MKKQKLEQIMLKFEKEVGEIIYGKNFNRESGNVPEHTYYQNGETNTLFRAYLLGYDYGKTDND